MRIHMLSSILDVVYLMCYPLLLMLSLGIIHPPVLHSGEPEQCHQARLQPTVLEINSAKDLMSQ